MASTLPRMPAAINAGRSISDECRFGTTYSSVIAATATTTVFHHWCSITATSTT